MVLVEQGIFNMGNEEEERERPVHQVTFTYDYMIGKYPVTFQEYDKFCEETGKSKPDDEGWGRENRPVIHVSWFDAIEYCNWLSKKEGLTEAYNAEGKLLNKNGEVTTDITQVEGYRLPTEAEWEFAARGGNKSQNYIFSGSNILDEISWYWDNSDLGEGRQTQPVGQKLSNELEIYDMSGNVWEWTTCLYQDYTSSAKTNPYMNSSDNNLDNYRVVRGGSWRSRENNIRVAYRLSLNPTNQSYNYGFRIVRTVF